MGYKSRKFVVTLFCVSMGSMVQLIAIYKLYTGDSLGGYFMLLGAGIASYNVMNAVQKIKGGNNE